MNCHQAEELIPRWLDGELDSDVASGLEAHIASCEACAKLAQKYRYLSVAIKSGEPVLAPDVLRSVIRARTVGRPDFRDPIFFGLGFAAAVAIFVLGNFMIEAQRASSDQNVLLKSHLHALATTLVQVPSSSRHTVKPWFQGKIDFAPAVPDLSADGFDLIGGRLDEVNGKNAPVLVYKRGLHVIDVYVFDKRFSGQRESATKGFHVAEFGVGELDYLAISDADADAVKHFATRFQQVAKP